MLEAKMQAADEALCAGSREVPRGLTSAELLPCFGTAGGTG